MHACPVGKPMSGINVGNDELLCGSFGSTYDLGTQRNGMHSCPVGTYVAGVHVSDNVLLCAATPGSSYTSAQEWIDYGSQLQGMHACPTNSAITGVHVGANLLACAPAYDGWPNSRFVDAFGDDSAEAGGPGGGNLMHACPQRPPGVDQSRFPASGLHVGRNLLLCGAGSFGMAGTFVDASTFRNGIHSCPNAAFMTGVHVGRDLLLCNTAFPNQGGEYLDYGTVVYGSTHGCLPGFAMTGVDVGRNVFGCAHTTGVAAPGGGVNPGSYQSNFMLSCSNNKPMSGLNVAANWAPCEVR
jgi:hypothetical protein